jgi:putative hemolysin
LGWLFAPFRLVLRLITDIITSPLTKFLVLKKYALSGDALKTIIAIGHEEGYLDNWQKIIFDGYFDLAEKTARELMVPRTEIFYVNYQDSFEELINKISDQNFSRIPVIAGSIDEIKGIIYTKEILKLRNLDESQQKNWPEIIRPAFFVPESKKADELLKELIVSGRHLALVLDEYGGLSGLITLEDLLENIFTGINKPHVTPKIKFLTPGVAVVSGNLEIKKFNRIFQAHLKDPFNETLAGFIISRMDKIPQAMENFRWDDFSFLILRATPQKILEIQVSKIIPVDSGKKFFS